jgi:hypothetical protein
MMDHPNIAKVLDAGATQYGRPYFVMELVRGGKRSPTIATRSSFRRKNESRSSSRSARRCSTRTKRGSSTET